jgi:hypothetical protein
MSENKSITKKGSASHEEEDQSYRDLLVKEMMQKLQQKIVQNDQGFIKALKLMITEDEKPKK